MKSVIITGASGFIGSSLAGKFIQNGVKVVAVDIKFAPLPVIDSPLITKVEAPVTPDLAEKIPADEYEALYHLAWRGVNGADKADPSVQLANIQMAIDCANICKRLKVGKLLCAGTVAENATFSLPDLQKTSGGMMYGVAKHACQLIVEDYCKNIGQPFVWMQFSNIYGVGNKTGNLVSYTLGEILEGKEASFGPAKQPYDFIYVDDLIEAAYRLGGNNTDKAFYYIGSGKPRILKEFLTNIGEIAGCADKVKIGMRPDDGIKYKMEMFDNTDLVKSIGEYVKVNFDEGIRRTIDWLKES